MGVCIINSGFLTVKEPDAGISIVVSLSKASVIVNVSAGLIGTMLSFTGQKYVPPGRTALLIGSGVVLPDFL